MSFRVYLSITSRPTATLTHLRFCRSSSAIACTRPFATAASPSISPVRRIGRGIFRYCIAPFVSLSIGYAAALYIMSAAADTEVPEDKIVYDPEIDATIEALPLVHSLRSDPRFTESRPHTAAPDHLKEQMLTAGVLSGPGRLSVPPIIWNDAETHELISVVHLGKNLCGHPGIVHGGLLATLLDEGLCSCAFPALPSKVGVTANLNLNYRSPAYADRLYVMRANVTKVDGRKAWVKGHIETVPEDGNDPAVVVEAEMLVVEPKWAKSLPKVVNVTA
ncbi:HotDog domain-containing protein [Lipomyces tetrasporus]|uniref:HotDog domain-containing protein n=1 Tax=Lipomyces tetrasporus TaxID=54092 RepID=A0AAD7QPQ3_9ASCO|nr:HotDog domain-containing protein [Lipomyces tetrasporus]KAJ8098676.1 HotDog domain-containing protein [Lipomyces tetrasporus]